MKHLIIAAWLGLAAAAAKLGGWVELPLATWNIGPAKHLPEQLGGRVPAAVGLQEASDQHDRHGIVSLLREVGYKIITGAKPGQPATPLAYDPTRLRLIKVKRYLLSEDQDAGPGAGPDHVKQKWAIGGLFEILGTGRQGWIFAEHWAASQQHHRRFMLALKAANRVAMLGHRLRRPVWRLLDSNAKPDSKVFGPLRKAGGWLVDQVVGRMLGTHGKRAIDQIWWQVRRWIRFLRHQVFDTESDHDLDIAWFAIKPRRRKDAA